MENGKRSKKTQILGLGGCALARVVALKRDPSPEVEISNSSVVLEARYGAVEHNNESCT